MASCCQRDCCFTIVCESNASEKCIDSGIYRSSKDTKGHTSLATRRLFQRRLKHARLPIVTIIREHLINLNFSSDGQPLQFVTEFRCLGHMVLIY